jgi:hypothetical protein
MRLELFRQVSEKCSNIKFHENQSSRSRVVPCGQTDGQKDRQTDRQADMKKLILAFRNFANSPKKKLVDLQKKAMLSVQNS